MTNEENKYEGHCWQCIPCYYDDFKTEPTDRYSGDIFGSVSGFGSPHWLYRRFHKNFCKTRIFALLKDYSLNDSEDNYSKEYEVYQIQDQYYSVEKLALHSALVLLIGTCEIYLKDCFKHILQYIYPEKINTQSLDKIVRRYNFQNIESTAKAFKWLLPDFSSDIAFNGYYGNDIDFENQLRDMFNLRHKIIHESYYDDSLNKEKFEEFCVLCIKWIDNFHYFFVDNGYYEKLDQKYDNIFK